MTFVKTGAALAWVTLVSGCLSGPMDPRSMQMDFEDENGRSTFYGRAGSQWNMDEVQLEARRSCSGQEPGQQYQVPLETFAVTSPDANGEWQFKGVCAIH